MREENPNSHAAGNRDYRILVLLVVGFIIGLSSFAMGKAGKLSYANRQNRQDPVRMETIFPSGSDIPDKLRPFVFLPVRLNSADKTLLETIPGIGPRLAERIIALRTEKIEFRDINELLAVEGIGQKKLAAIRQYCSL